MEQQHFFSAILSDDQSSNPCTASINSSFSCSAFIVFSFQTVHISSCNSTTTTKPFIRSVWGRLLLVTLFLAFCSADFYNWNRVFVRYCDGSSFTGDVEKVDPVSNTISL